MQNKYFIVGKVLNHETKTWEFSGLFSDEEKAIAYCITENYFLAEVKLNEFTGDETSDFDYAYYPLLSKF